MSDLVAFLRARVCVVAGCDRDGKLTRGMCARCYRRWLDQTPPDQRGVAPRFNRDFWNFVEKSHEHGCWTWTGPRDRSGYGRWSRVLAHRHSWALANGPVPPGKWILHHCDNPPCVNPAHLYPGTVLENTRDAVARGRNHVPPRNTHCISGHAISGSNRRVVSGRALCRICDNRKSRDTQRALRAARSAPPPPAGRLITAEALSRYSIARTTLFEWQRSGWISSVKVGRDAWWPQGDLERLVAAREGKAT